MTLQKLDPNQNDKSVACTVYTVTLLDGAGSEIGSTCVLSNSPDNGITYVQGYGRFERGHEHWWLQDKFMSAVPNAQSIRFDATSCSNDQEVEALLSTKPVRGSSELGADEAYDVLAKIDTTWRMSDGPRWSNVFYNSYFDVDSEIGRAYAIHIAESAVTWFVYIATMPTDYIVSQSGMIFRRQKNYGLYQGAFWRRSSTC